MIAWGATHLPRLAALPMGTYTLLPQPPRLVPLIPAPFLIGVTLSLGVVPRASGAVSLALNRGSVEAQHVRK